MLNFVRYTLIVGLAALFAGCGGSQPPIGAPGAMPPASALSARGAKYRVLHVFGGSNDGSSPGAPLLNVGGTLYGTTTAGGTYGKGTVFSLTTGSTEKVLYSFGTSTTLDGSLPAAGLIDVHGTLYGTTVYGGANSCYSRGCGTVFSITLGGVEKVLHSFGGGTDGRLPEASLIDVKGRLYGTTIYGGANACGNTNSCGTIFSITPGGTEKVLYSFDCYGRWPVAALINVGGTLYGTTSWGGCDSYVVAGTVFSIPAVGTKRNLTILHGFSGDDGNTPVASLIDVKGRLYGTTEYGGGDGRCDYEYQRGCGTVFSVTTDSADGKEKVLHSFSHGTDGEVPLASLIDVKGTLYGTTWLGGAYNLGTVFSVTMGGEEKVLHSFSGPPDGSFPTAGLISVKGRLYGTTSAGGTSGNGTVFALTLR